MKRVYFFVTLFVVNLVISMNVITGGNNSQEVSQEVIAQKDDHGVTPVSPKRNRALLAVCQSVCAIQQQHPVTPLDQTVHTQDDESRLARQQSENFLRNIPSMGDLPLVQSGIDLDASLVGLKITSSASALAPYDRCHEFAGSPVRTVISLAFPANTFHGVTPIKNSVPHGVLPAQARHDVTPIGK